MLKKAFSLLAVLMIGFSANASAEEQEVQKSQQEKKTIELPQWVKNIKFSGYGMLQYQGQDPEGNHSNTFNLRLARFILDGKIGDFDWRAQIHGAVQTLLHIREPHPPHHTGLAWLCRRDQQALCLWRPYR